MKYPKIREVVEALKAVIVGPYTSKFPAKPHVPHPNFRGQPVFNEEKCVGCLSCEEVCPVNAIEHLDNTDPSNPKRTIYHHTDTCIFCGECETHCIANHEGIKLGNDWDLSFFDRKKEATESIEKDLQLCEKCGATIACRDHLKWIAEKVGELAYSNPALYLSRLKSLGIADENIKAVLNKGSWRSETVQILCARCRREATFSTTK